MKLGSVIAPIRRLLDEGVSLSLGADGAACNNRLDMFTEMRTAALIQKALHGAEALPAVTMLRMATIDGARALGLDKEIGSIEKDHLADLVILNANPLETVAQNSENRKSNERYAGSDGIDQWPAYFAFNALRRYPYSGSKNDWPR